MHGGDLPTPASRTSHRPLSLKKEGTSNHVLPAQSIYDKAGSASAWYIIPTRLLSRVPLEMPYTLDIPLLENPRLCNKCELSSPQILQALTNLREVSNMCKYTETHLKTMSCTADHYTTSRTRVDWKGLGKDPCRRRKGSDGLCGKAELVVKLTSDQYQHGDCAQCKQLLRVPET
jgi:hypothetical protein